MSPLFGNAASSHYGTHYMVICKRWIVTNAEESSCSAITVISRRLEKGTKVGVPVEFRIITSGIQACRVTAIPICSVYVINLIHRFDFKKVERALGKKRFHKDEFTLTSEISLFYARIPENVQHKIVEKKHSLFHWIYSYTVSEINVTIFV
jgi:hypothetical protein